MSCTQPIIFYRNKNISCSNIPNHLILNDDGSLYSVDNVDVGDYLLTSLYEYESFKTNVFYKINNLSFFHL